MNSFSFTLSFPVLRDPTLKHPVRTPEEPYRQLKDIATLAQKGFCVIGKPRLSGVRVVMQHQEPIQAFELALPLRSPAISWLAAVLYSVPCSCSTWPKRSKRPGRCVAVPIKRVWKTLN